MTEGALRSSGATLLQTSNLSRADIELIPSVEFDTITVQRLNRPLVGPN